MSVLTTSGSPFFMKTSMTVPLAFDVSAQLGPGDTVTNPVTTLVDKNGASVTLTDNPQVSGNVITQIVRGSVLAASHQYVINVTYTANTNKVLGVDAVIICVP